MSRTFYDYFNANMKSLQLPAPESLFGTITTATANIGKMVKFIDRYGTRATVAEMVLTSPGAAAGAGGGIVGISAAASELLVAVGALSAAYYIGACVTSLAVAEGKKTAGCVSLSDCMETANSYEIETPGWLKNTLTSNLALLGMSSPISPSEYPTWTA